MGLEDPILFNSTKAKEASLSLGTIPYNFSMINSKAPTT